MVKVIKRDGRIVDFDKRKISNAIIKAMEKLKGEIDTSLANEIADGIELMQENLTVEEIQDIVEESLMCSERKDVAKEYITYRANRTRIRERDNELKRKIKSIVNCENVQNSNANVDEHAFGGRKFESAGALHKDIALDMMSEKVRNAFQDWYIYIHDLDTYDIGEHNCLFVDMKSLLANGFETRNGGVRGANSFSTACQLVAVIFQAQSQVR